MKKSKFIVMNEEERLKQFEEIAKNWDNLPEKAQGRLEGEIAMAHALLCSEEKQNQGGKKEDRRDDYDDTNE